MSDYQRPPPLFRTTDPPTSAKAARLAAASGIIKGHEALILSILSRIGPATAKQIAAASDGEFDSVQVSRRIAAMIAKRLVHYEGEGQDGCGILKLGENA